MQSLQEDAQVQVRRFRCLEVQDPCAAQARRQQHRRMGPRREEWLLLRWLATDVGRLQHEGYLFLVLVLVRINCLFINLAELI